MPYERQKLKTTALSLSRPITEVKQRRARSVLDRVFVLGTPRAVVLLFYVRNLSQKKHYIQNYGDQHYKKTNQDIVNNFVIQHAR